MKENPVILFDGICNLCNWIVNFIIKKDPESYFKFTPFAVFPRTAFTGKTWV